MVHHLLGFCCPGFCAVCKNGGKPHSSSQHCRLIVLRSCACLIFSSILSEASPGNGYFLGGPFVTIVGIVALFFRPYQLSMVQPHWLCNMPAVQSNHTTC